MGYTHYWSWKKRPSAAKLQAAIRDIAKVVRSAASGFLAGGNGEGKPLVTPTEVAFNGSSGDSYETFAFPGDFPEGTDDSSDGFNFTKTARRPYDAFVTAALIVVRQHFDTDVLEIRSDGDPEEWIDGPSEDVQGGFRIYVHVFQKRPRLDFLDPSRATYRAFVEELAKLQARGVPLRTREAQTYAPKAG